MVTITCPWCADDGLLELTDLAAAEAGFTCPDCGTNVSFADESTTVSEVAA